MKRSNCSRRPLAAYDSCQRWGLQAPLQTHPAAYLKLSPAMPDWIAPQVPAAGTLLSRIPAGMQILSMDLQLAGMASAALPRGGFRASNRILH